MTAAGLLHLQRSAGNAAVGRALQREQHQHGPGCGHVDAAPSVQRVEGGIADRVRRRNQAERAHSPRLREQAEGGRGRTSYAEPRTRGIWDGTARFDYLPGVQDALFAPHRVAGRTDLYKCPDCQSDVPRYDPANPHQNGMTVEHVTPYRQWIMEHAEPDESGQISNEAAQAAYSDARNLRALCRDCNSSLGGDRGLFG